uniref:Exonuclease domain-containing protein n=1 Tax=Aegilops tauschii subsp. strangulata TaxID=200361 RepID=A0A453JX07_AEGTS
PRKPSPELPPPPPIYPALAHPRPPPSTTCPCPSSLGKLESTEGSQMETASAAAAAVEEGSTAGPQAGGAEIAFFDLETSVPQRAGQGYALLEFGAILVCPRRLVEVVCYATLV